MRLFCLLPPLVVLCATMPATAQDPAVGAALYADFCAVCHGEALRGDGPMAEALTVQPPDLTAISGGGDFPVLAVASQIDGRDPLLAHGGEMPLFGAWFEGDGADVPMRTASGQPVMLSRPIADLIAYLMENQS